VYEYFVIIPYVYTYLRTYLTIYLVTCLHIRTHWKFTGFASFRRMSVHRGWVQELKGGQRRVRRKQVQEKSCATVGGSFWISPGHIIYFNVISFVFVISDAENCAEKHFVTCTC